MTDSTRRKFLASTTTLVSLGLAGCSEIFNNSEPTTNDSDENPNVEDRFGGYNNTSEEPPDFEVPDGGYIDAESGQVKEGVLDNAKPTEYLIAAQESYEYMGENLQRSYENYSDMIDILNRDNIDFELAREKWSGARYWADWALFFNEQTITLLQEIEERNAIAKVQETNTLLEEEYYPFVKDRTDEFITKYENGDIQYVSENASEIYNQFQDYRNSANYWPIIIEEIDTSKYPGYTPTA